MSLASEWAAAINVAEARVASSSPREYDRAVRARDEIARRRPRFMLRQTEFANVDYNGDLMMYDKNAVLTPTEAIALSKWIVDTFEKPALRTERAALRRIVIEKDATVATKEPT